MEPMFTNPFWENRAGDWLIGFPALQVSKEFYLLAGPGNLGYFEDPEKRGIHLDL